ncbi:MAG: FAD/NAD(P)-binding protein [Dethiobacter sp.]|jgi:NAD(P)H-flavin reductase|nr:FAD/NAD(P)-binding protein [Dethiobacter sp.]MBS3899206.1 FAD/NAD(P)-binding protein [Dethiobacter sp.]MCL4462572.1 FAD/NAD(P)-binding protein [Bacillota bacterium]
MNTHPYIPNFATVQDTWYETYGDRCIKTFKVGFDDEEVRDSWTHLPGQCAMIGVLGTGESMISISCSPTEGKFLRFSVMRAGKVTKALHELEAGDKMTVRGPYGNNFPIDEWKGKNIITIGGGIGQAPLRPVIEYVRAKKSEYGELTVVYGARTSADLCFKGEFGELARIENTCYHLSVDVKEEGWPHYVGFVPALLMEVNPSPENTIAITCGPPIMINFVLQNLKKLNFPDDQIYTTLENRMKCGIGKCGRCNAGNLYVCKDGPVFSYATLKNVPEAFA